MSSCVEMIVAERLPVDQAHRDRIRHERQANQFVEAGAGSGKTRALVDRVEALVDDDGNALDSIAAITFSEKAAAELRDRVRQRFEAATRSDNPSIAARARDALLQLDGAAIGTLHSFAQRLLAEHPVEAGLPPGVDVLDEISSQVDFEQRWQVFLDALLDDDTTAHTLLCLEAAVRPMTCAASPCRWQTTGISWRSDSTSMRRRPRPSIVQLEPHRRHSQLGQYAAHDDSLLARFLDSRNRADLAGAVDDIDALSIAADMGSANKATRTIRVRNKGNKHKWTIDVADVRAAFVDLIAACDDVVAQVTTAALAWPLGRPVRARHRRGASRDRSARVSRSPGPARRLLRSPAHGAAVRHSLGMRYPRLLLDEFQDTDPIQIELRS